MVDAQNAWGCRAHRLSTKADAVRLRSGNVVLVFDCNRFGHKHHRCKSRPNMVWKVDDETATLLPFSSSVKSAVFFEAGEGGLMVGSYLQPRSYLLPLHKIGTIVGVIEPRTVLLRIITSLLEEARVGLKGAWVKPISSVPRQLGASARASTKP